MDSIPVQSSEEGATRWGLVTARDIMRTDVIVIHYATPIRDVERILSENNISGAPVTDEAGRVMGVVSMKDLIERYTQDSDAHGRVVQGFYHVSGDESFGDANLPEFQFAEESGLTAQSIMTAQVHAVPADAGLKEIASAMVSHKIHRVLVEDEGKHVGLIGTLEILDALSA